MLVVILLPAKLIFKLERVAYQLIYWKYDTHGKLNRMEY